MNRPGGDPVTRRTFWDLKNQQQAMSVAFFFMMMFVLLSGLFTSIERMPTWEKVIAYCNPVTYFIAVIRLIILKGSGFKDLLLQFLVITAMAFFFNTWAVVHYKKNELTNQRIIWRRGGFSFFLNLGLCEVSWLRYP